MFCFYWYFHLSSSLPAKPANARLIQKMNNRLSGNKISPDFIDSRIAFLFHKFSGTFKNSIINWRNDTYYIFKSLRFWYFSFSLHLSTKNDSWKNYLQIEKSLKLLKQYRMVFCKNKWAVKIFTCICCKTFQVPHVWEMPWETIKFILRLFVFIGITDGWLCAVTLKHLFCIHLKFRDNLIVILKILI